MREAMQDKDIRLVCWITPTRRKRANTHPPSPTLPPSPSLFLSFSLSLQQPLELHFKAGEIPTHNCNWRRLAAAAVAAGKSNRQANWVDGNPTLP